MRSMMELLDRITEGAVRNSAVQDFTDFTARERRPERSHVTSRGNEPAFPFQSRPLTCHGSAGRHHCAERQLRTPSRRPRADDASVYDG